MAAWLWRLTHLVSPYTEAGLSVTPQPPRQWSPRHCPPFTCQQLLLTSKPKCGALNKNIAVEILYHPPHMPYTRHPPGPPLKNDVSVCTGDVERCFKMQSQTFETKDKSLLLVYVSQNQEKVINKIFWPNPGQRSNNNNNNNCKTLRQEFNIFFSVVHQGSGVCQVMIYG